MKIIFKMFLGCCVLVSSFSLFAMQAPAGNDAAPVITGSLDTYQAKWQEWKRRSNRLDDLKKEKALPFKIGALAGGAVLTAAAARLILNRSDSKLKAALAIGTLAVGAIASWFGFNKLLSKFIKRCPAIIQARREKHDYGQAVIDWVWRAEIPSPVQIGEFHNVHQENFTQRLMWNIHARGSGASRDQLAQIPKNTQTYLLIYVKML